MRQARLDPDIWRVYTTTFVLGVAYGIAISLIAVFLDERGFEKQAIGTLAACFASGIVGFSLPAGALIRREAYSRQFNDRRRPPLRRSACGGRL